MSRYQQLLSEYIPTQTEYEHHDGVHRHHVIILAVFDHDWEQHLLVQQCTTGGASRLLGMDKWEYVLYYVSGEDVIHIHTFFDAESAPLVEAAQLATCWLKEGHYGGMSNSVESDSFD